MIIAEQPPVAQFSYTPSDPSNLNSTIQLINQSENATDWQWYFDDTDSSFQMSPEYTFSDTGWHQITFIVEDQNDCKDTILKQIDILPLNTFFLPNAFTPNNDGLNDCLKGKGILDGATAFHLRLYNRWGQLIYNAYDSNDCWDGILPNGQPAPQGLYLCKLQYLNPRKNNITLSKKIHLIR